MKAEEFNKILNEVNNKILEKIKEKESGLRIKEKDRIKIKVARDYFCDAIILAMGKNLKLAEYKLKQALTILNEME